MQELQTGATGAKKKQEVGKRGVSQRVSDRTGRWDRMQTWKRKHSLTDRLEMNPREAPSGKEQEERLLRI